MFDPVTIAGAAGLAALVEPIIDAAVDKAKELATHVAGGILHEKYHEVERHIRERIPRFTGFPANHDVRRGVRLAQLQALGYVLNNYERSNPPEWKDDPVNKPKWFLDTAVAYVRSQLPFRGEIEVEGTEAQTQAIDAGVETIVAALASSPPPSGHDAVRGLAEDAVLAELLVKLDGIVLPKDFENRFRGNSPPAVGWFSAFTRYLAEQIKDNERFRNILITDLLADLTQLGLATQDIGRALDATVNRMATSLDRIETKVDAMEDANARRHREQLEATEALRRDIAREKGVDPAVLIPLFEHLGHKGLSQDELRERAEEAIRETIARSQQKVAPSNEGADIDAAIAAVRQKLSVLDTAAADALLDDKIAAEEEVRRQRLVPLLQEKAAIAKLRYDYESAKVTLNRLLALDPDAVWSWIDLGDLFVTVGSLGEAATAFRSASDAARRTGDQRDLSVSYNKIGDVLVAQGNLPEALKSFRDGLAIADRLATADPGNAGWQRDLSVSYDKIGDVLVAQGNLPEALKSFRDGLAIRDRLATADPGNAGWQRDLSVSYNKIGDVLVAQGNLPEALKSFRDSHDIFDRLATADPGNAGWQRDLSVSYNKIGDVLVAQGNLPEALKSFRDSHDIFDRLATADPGNAGWQRDLSVSYNKIGDVLVAQGNLPEALKSFRDSHDIFDRLATADPGNAGWQRDLSVSYDRVGDVLVAQGNLPEALKSFRDGLAIRDRLATADPGNAGWQRDLSVSYDRVGDVLVAQGNLPEALKSFRDGLAIRDRLATADPGNAGWQRDLSVSYNKIGDVQVAQGNLPEALKSFRDGLAIRDRLATADPGNAGWQRDLIVSYVKLAGIDQTGARSFLARAKQIAEQMQQRGQLAPRDLWMLGDLAKRIAAMAT